MEERDKCFAKLEGSFRCGGSTEERSLIKLVGVGKADGKGERRWSGQVAKRNGCLRWSLTNAWEFTVGRRPSRKKEQHVAEAWRQRERGGSVSLDLGVWTW